MVRAWDEAGALEAVRGVVSRQLPRGVKPPGDDEDLAQSGLIDSMGWVEILTAFEELTGISNWGNPWPEGRSQSIRALASLLREASLPLTSAPTSVRMRGASARGSKVSVAGWGHVLGSLRVDAATIERECGLEPATISQRAGIESVRRAGNSEDEVSLGFDAAEIALSEARLKPDDIDFLVATTATWLAFPSLAARLHARLMLREACGALDVGGACVGVIHSLVIARSFLAVGGGTALVVASELNSRRLLRTPGGFRGLFGDGASAFILSASEGGSPGHGATVGEFVWGCADSQSSALRLALSEAGSVDVEFKGEQLAAIAVSTLVKVLKALESCSGVPLSEVTRFALHEPNPRVVSILGERLKIPSEKVAMVSKQAGNLGSATCGVSLCNALAQTRAHPPGDRASVTFIAAVGPGLLWGGTYLY